MGDGLRIQDFADNYDPFHALQTIGGEEKVIDPYPELKRLRAQAPVHDFDIRAHFGVPGDPNLADLKAVTVLGHDAVHAVLGDPDNFANAINDRFLGKAFGRSITTMDPPEHTRYRRLFQKAFLPMMIEGYRKEMVPRVINRLVDAIAGRGQAELVGDFARHFAFNFIHELLELPPADRLIFQKLAVGQLAVSFDPLHGAEAVAKLTAYLEALVEARRSRPVSERDFIHVIANAEVDSERLPNHIVVAFLRQLMNAGGDTSYHGFSSILAALLTHPEQLEAVRKDRALVPRAIEEGLRWNCPVLFIFRAPAHETVLGGITLRPGEHYLNVSIGSANRDDSHWPDADRFDITRPPQRHAAFGYGLHVCIGQHLARMEMEVALNILLDRLPNLRLDATRPPPVVRGLLFRGPDAIHVDFD